MKAQVSAFYHRDSVASCSLTLSTKEASAQYLDCQVDKSRLICQLDNPNTAQRSSREPYALVIRPKIRGRLTPGTVRHGRKE